LLTRQLDAEKSRRYVQTINGQASQLKQIIDDLLDVTRLESGRALDLQASLISLDKLIADALEVFADASIDRCFTFRPAVEKVQVRADPFRLAQVLRNLLSNAVKYSTAGTEVEVALKVQADAVQISVRDEGIGMTPAQLSHMFEKFYRSQQAIQMSTGTGLGLSISKTIIEAHGGRIWVESEVGVGSTFSFVLPLGQEEPQPLLQAEPGDHLDQGHA
jgi:signal transduction histidine kinase